MSVPGNEPDCLSLFTYVNGSLLSSEGLRTLVFLEARERRVPFDGDKNG